LVSGVFSLPLHDPAGPVREFFAGEENVLLRSAISAVTRSPAECMPLVLYGPSGAGKTFLAEGLAEAWREAAPETATPRNVLRTTGTEFARQYADACDTDSIGDFRESFRLPGLILVDAIHALGTKDKATREFCFQLDAWVACGKAVVITSLRAPLHLVNEGLASRLSGGLVVPVALPSLAARRELLTYFARQRSLDLPDGVIESLAKRVPGTVTHEPSPRDLQAALLQLESTASLTGCEIDEKLITSLFDSPINPGEIDFKRILTLVCKRYGVTLDELRSSSRRQTLVRARGVAIVLARRLTSESLQSLGKALGKRDHSTIHHAMQTTEEALTADGSLRQLIESLEQELTHTNPKR
jgi:chromosomal replication initiator protein